MADHGGPYRSGGTFPRRPYSGHPPSVQRAQSAPVSARVLSAALGHFEFRFAYDPNLSRSLRREGPFRWNPDRQAWTLQATFGMALLSQRIAKEYAFHIEPSAWTMMRRLADEANLRTDQSKATKAEAIDLKGFGKTLLPYQVAAVAYGLENDSVLNADEVGLGKTVESLATLWARKAFPAIVVVPAHLKLNWIKEIEACCPGTATMLIKKKKVQPIPADFKGIIVINYDILNAWLPALLEFIEVAHVQAIIFDESQYLKESSSKRSQAAEELAKRVPIRHGLSATPIKNRPVELVQQLKVLDLLDAAGGFWYFVKTFCDAHEREVSRWDPRSQQYYARRFWDMDGASNLPQLNTLLHGIGMLRRLKVEVIDELPPKRRSEIPIELEDPKQYKAAVADFKEWVRKQGGDVNKVNEASRFEQIRHLVGQGKVKAAVEWIKTFLESGEKLIVYAYHRDVQQAIAQAFPNAARLFSIDSRETQEREKQRFQEDPLCLLIVCSLMGAGTGHTLTAASNMVIVEPAFSPLDHEQAEGRAYTRINDLHGLNSYFLLANGTIDDRVFDIVERKQKIFSAAVGDNVDTFRTNVQQTVIRGLLEESA